MWCRPEPLQEFIGELILIEARLCDHPRGRSVARLDHTDSVRAETDLLRWAVLGGLIH